MSKSRWYSFTAPVYKLGINRCVDVPETFSGLCESKNFVPVVIEVKGIEYGTTFVPRGNGQYRLFIKSELRKAAGVDHGDAIHVRFRIDASQGRMDLPEDIVWALETTDGGMEMYRNLPSGLKREFIRWVEAAKQEQTRADRIVTGIRRLMVRKK